jgi:lipopolysaccharide/colanic/teichoic acid biosynthesis glycosyltransferase
MKRELISKEQGAEAAAFIEERTDISSTQTHVIKTFHLFNIEAIDKECCRAIVNLNKINDVNGINLFLREIYSKLPEGGTFIGCVETQTQRKHRLLKKYPFIIAQIYFFFDFIFKRVFPKIKMTRWLYFFVTAGRNRVLSKAEALGRLIYNGFNIDETKEIGYLTYFCCTKKVAVLPERVPSLGFFFKMQRIGKYNRPITVYKIRTMHPYAEYLQEYIYQQNSLKEGGKFNNDFRITSWGRFFRRFWIDEIPMILNFLKGEIKLVGVRPLSKHYLSLYTDELKEKRKEVKPGLVPPFYADLPVSLEEIMRSEMNYIASYQASPLKTDYEYFKRAMINILFRHARTN